MPARIRHITIDCQDPTRLAAFWSAALGFEEDPDDPNDDDGEEVLLVDPLRLHPALLFIAVPEPKAVKNRIHVDVTPDRPRDEAVDALCAIGATLVADHRRPDGTEWAVLADPEGNEFCVERSAAERGEPPPAQPAERDMADVRTAGEMELLAAMLEWYREGVIAKIRWLPASRMRTSPVVSGTTIAGLVKHLALVEDSWFEDRFAGNPDPEPWASVDWDADRDWEFHSAVEDAPEDLLALYEAACLRSRAAIVGHALDDLAANSPQRPFTLRFALVHLIEETARHLGHLDILRELADGATGE